LRDKTQRIPVRAYDEVRYREGRNGTFAMQRWQQAVVAAVARAAGVEPSAPASWSVTAGSSLNSTASLALGGRRFFVKTNGAERAPMLEAEADGLAAIAATGAIRVPAPVASGVAGDRAYLALEWLDFARGGRDAALGRALAAMHGSVGARFGWHRDNTIGTTPQSNAYADSWAEFFRDRRLAPQLALAAERGHRGALQRDGERLLDAVPALLAGHAAAPSLVHGDLWSGNAGALAGGEPAIFDPAVHYGDREVDVAMSELFGGFGADFYAAYDDAWPRAHGYATRRTLYNLYHVLNHCNLFGGGYGAQAHAMIRRLLAEVG
jgi:fructosamine-3-kinase